MSHPLNFKFDMSDDPALSAPENEIFDADLIGFLGNALGLGEAARLVNDALRSAGVKVQTINREVPGLAEVDYPFDHGDIANLEDFHPSPLFICCVNGEHMPSLIAPMGEDLFFDRKVVGIWYWETANLPERVLDALPYLDEVWLSSEFIADAVRRSAPKELIVRTFPHPIRIPPAEIDLPSSDRFDFDGRYLFLFSFDFNSSYRRKNPHAVCEAFAQAFPDPLENGPICIIKSINGHKLQRVPFQLLKSRWAHRPDIVFMDEFLDYEDRERLFRRADCYVSLHRAEGLGLTLMEAMALGKPCISTNYSGNLAFMTAENSYLVDYELDKVGHADLHYPPEDLWAEPNIAQAAEAMQACFMRTEEARSKAKKGKEDIIAFHSMEPAGLALKKLVQESSLVSGRPRQRPSEIMPVERSQAIEPSETIVDHVAKTRDSLQELRDLENELKKLLSQKIIHSKKLVRLSEKSSLKARKGIEHSLKLSIREHKAFNSRLKEIEQRLGGVEHHARSLTHRADFQERNFEELMRHVLMLTKQSSDSSK